MPASVSFTLVTSVMLAAVALWPPASVAATVVELTGGSTSGFSANMKPNGITAGPDGNIWFTESADPGGVARVNGNGTITELTGGVTPGFTANRIPGQITTGPDGNIWFTEAGNPGAIARVNADGTVTEFTGGVTSGFSANAAPEGITSGPDGNIWFTESELGSGACSGGLGACGGLGRLNSDGTVTQFEAGHNLPGMTPYTYPSSITAGSDGNLWFTEPNLIRNNVTVTGVGRLNLGFATVTEFPAGTTPGFTLYSEPQSITSGTGGHVWWTELGGDGGVGLMNGDATVTEYGDGTAGYTAADHPNGIAAGPDGDMWFTQSVNPGLVGRINADGTITELTGGSNAGFSANGDPNGIVGGSDGNVWFTGGADPGRVAFVASPPSVATGAASGVGMVSATLNGWVSPHHTAVSDCHFDYGTSTSYGSSIPCQQAVGAGTSPVGVSADLPDVSHPALKPATTYHFRVVATNLGGTSYGTDQSFTTAAAAPVVSTGQAVSVTQSSTTLTGAVVPDGATVTDCHFEYGATTAYGANVPCTPSVGGGSAPVSVSAAVSGLQPGAAYHFRLVATNVVGTGHGDDRRFTALPPVAPGAPIVATGGASAVALTTATLNGTVNPQGSATTYHFEYGTSTAYGTNAPAPDAAAGSDHSTHALSTAISGLAPGTTYHVRIVAVNDAGTSDGADVTFTMLAPDPHVQPPVLSALTLMPARFRAASRGARIAAARRPPAWATINYRDSTSATATLTIQRQIAGVKVGKSCLTRHRRGHKHIHRCLRVVIVGTFTHADNAGRNHLRFTGWISSKNLAPGNYTLLVRATNDGGSSGTLKTRFTIVR